MRLIDPESLKRHNLAYREPTLYDALLADTCLATEIIALGPETTTGPTTVLDMGCGTGRVLAQLHDHDLVGTGIDIQPDLIAWAQGAHPGLRLEVGDIRSVRLDETFDLIICLGNTLSYLHTEPELDAAFTTAAAHSRPGTVLAIATLTGAARDFHGTDAIDTPLGRATVEVASAWHPDTAVLAGTRTWRFPDGRVENDTMHRRFWPHDSLTDHVRRAGFRSFPTTSPSLTLCATWPDDDGHPAAQR